MDINITSQIVVQTAAQWAADATIYSAKRILVTSDAVYTGTDQRKYKIPNGTDTWSNLDYFPAGGSETLAQTLALGNTTGANDIIHTSTTASTVPYLDASKILVSSAVTPTQLSYVDATSSIQTQLDAKSDLSASSTGIVTGGYLSIGTPNTTFSISDGTGMVVDNTVTPATIANVTWTGKTNIPATFIAAGLVSYVAIDDTGAVVQQLAPFTNTQQRQYIVLGSLIHVNLTNLDAINQFGEIAISPLSQLSDLTSALGRFNITGNVFSANGANLNINKSTGTVYSEGSNWAVNTSDPNVVSLGSLTALTFQYRFQTGTNGTTGTSINPNIYDLAGVSTSVPSNKFTIQRIYSFVSNNVKIQPGQNLYQTLVEAKAALQIESFVTEPSIQANGILRGFLIVKQSATNLQNSTEAVFYEAGKFSGQIGVGGQSVSTLQNAYDNSSTTEILTDSTRGAVSVKRGSAADTDTIFEGLNGAGSTTFSVDGDGKINSAPLTASEMLITNANKDIVSAQVSTYPSLTELTYVKGVTSSIQTQLDLANIFTIPFSVVVTTVADATSYYFSLHYGFATSTVETRHQFQVGYACQVIGAVFGASDNTTTGTTEASTLKIRNITQATSTTIGGGSVYTNGSGTTTVMTTLTGGSVAVAATDYIAIELLAATFATNPATFKIEGWLYLKRV